MVARFLVGMLFRKHMEELLTRDELEQVAVEMAALGDIAAI